MTAQNVVLVARRPQNNSFCFRVRYNDHIGLSQLLAERRLHANSLVLDARYHERHGALRDDALKSGIKVCLDTQSMELALPISRSIDHNQLPWAGQDAQRPEVFTTAYQKKFINAVVTFACQGGYSSLLAPAHYLSANDSPWLEIDGNLVSLARRMLDDAGANNMAIVYPLALHGDVLYNAESRDRVIRHLKTLPIDGVSLRINRFGASAGPLVMRRIIDACSELQALQVPLTLERGGFSSIAAFAMGAIDCVESGIVFGDSFVGEGSQILEQNKSARFALPKRVYVESLGMTLKLDVANQLMKSSHGKLRFACNNRDCCPNGASDMLRDAHRHSALARQRQYAELAAIPKSSRANHFIQEMLASVCDALSHASDVHEPLRTIHRRILSVKETLRDLYNDRKDDLLSPEKAHERTRALPLAKVIPIHSSDPIGPQP